MDTSLFANSPSGRLVKQGTGEAGYYAFIPHSLPPELEFDLALVTALSDAAGAVGELAGLARALANPYLLVSPLIRREAVASSRIEGTEADLDELYIYEAEQPELPGMRAVDAESDLREVYNYVRALAHGLERLGDLPLSLRLVREVHGRLVAGVRGRHAAPGEFRRTQNWIGASGCPLNEAAYVPPPVPEMTRALGDLEAYLHADDGFPPLVRLALIHYQFEAVHPFVDGNGRIGRLLLSLLAVYWDLVPQPLLHLSPFFERHRQEYYDLLMSVSARGAWGEWIGFFLRAVTEQSRDAVDRTKRLLDLQTKWRDRVTKGHTSALLLRLLDSLFESPVISIPRAQEILGVTTYRGAQLNVEKLVEHGILHRLGEGTHPKLYIAREIIAVFRDDAPQT